MDRPFLIEICARLDKSLFANAIRRGHGLFLLLRSIRVPAYRAAIGAPFFDLGQGQVQE